MLISSIRFLFRTVLIHKLTTHFEEIEEVSDVEIVLGACVYSLPSLSTQEYIEMEGRRP